MESRKHGIYISYSLLYIFLLGFSFYIYHNSNAFLSFSIEPKATNDTNFYSTISNNTKSDYTLLVYMIGSDLESTSYAATKDLAEMKAAQQNPNTNIIVQTGGGGGNIDGNRFIDFDTVQRHKIANSTINTLMNMGKLNTGDPKSLSDFIKWGIKEFPAKKYSIILWDHGSGLNGFGKDILHHDDGLNLTELKKAFETAKSYTNTTFDIIGFDACVMSSLEVASHLQSYTKLMVSSEEVEPNWGWDYKSIISYLTTNPKTTAQSFAKLIVDSFVNQSTSFSISDKSVKNSDITLSVIDLSRLPILLNEIENTVIQISSLINDKGPAINLSKAISITENYGQTARGSSGFVDLYDLFSNIQTSFPALKEKINEINKDINSSVIYSFKGDARPYAHGLSVYMPLTKNEYSNTSELNVINPQWLNLLNIQKSMITADDQHPIIKSIREGNTINVHILGSDIASIYSKIITNSSKGHDFTYLQSMNPSVLSKENYLQYKDHKILEICNESKCIPVSMRLGIDKDKQFVFIPIRLEHNKTSSNDDNNYNKGNKNVGKDLNLSLIYEIDGNGKFIFLGANPEVDPSKTIPKGKIGLNAGDKIYFKGLPARATYEAVKSIIEEGVVNSTDFEDGPLIVNNPQMIHPLYANMTFPHALSFIFCDYSDNCDKSRWYYFNGPSEASGQKTVIIPRNLEFGFTANIEGKSNGNGNDDHNNFKTSQVFGNATTTTTTNTTYANPTFGFVLSHPANWTEQVEYVYDNSSMANIFADDLLVDPTVISLFPPIPKSESGNMPTSISISSNDWPFKDSSKSLFNFLNKTDNQKRSMAGNLKMLEAAPISVPNSSDAFKFTFEYISIPEIQMGIVKEPRIEQMISILMDKRMYIIDFSTYSSQFYSYLPTVNKIIESFRPYDNKSGNIHIIKTESINETQGFSSISKQGTALVFENYTDPKYNYQIEYPYYIGQEPFSNENSNSNTIGQTFVLNEQAVLSSNQGNEVNLLISPYFKDKIIGSFDAIPPIVMNQSGVKNFTLKDIINSQNSQLEVLSHMLPNFILVNKGLTTFKDIPAYNIEFKYFNPSNKSPTEQRYLTTIFGNYMYIFNYIANPDNYIKYMSLANKMLNSFQYKGIGGDDGRDRIY